MQWRKNVKFVKTAARSVSVASVVHISVKMRAGAGEERSLSKPLGVDLQTNKPWCHFLSLSVPVIPPVNLFKGRVCVQSSSTAGFDIPFYLFSSRKCKLTLLAVVLQGEPKVSPLRVSVDCRKCSGIGGLPLLLRSSSCLRSKPNPASTVRHSKY